MLIAFLALLLSLGIDYYIIRKIRRFSGGELIKKYCNYGFIVITSLQYAAMLAAMTLPKQGGSIYMLTAVTWFVFIFISILVSKSVFTVVDILGYLPKLFRRRPWKWMTRIGVVIGVIVFLMMWWGALINRFRISETHITLRYSTLPPAFNGYKIVQLSDIHVGTWGNDTSFLDKVVSRVNNLEPDLIVFTGDIVNRTSKELEPMSGTLGRLHATDGVLAILGNHDYGDYYSWPSAKSHENDRVNLRQLYGTTDIRLLLNESVTIKRGNDSIVVIGVENIGNPPFSIYGDLDASYPDRADETFKILLSHNPSHWVNDIKDNPLENIALTLSGHTHAMQIQLAGISPASLLSPTPWGLYTDTLGRVLYVNRGIGTVGLPMRLGATPEISVFTLYVK